MKISTILGLFLVLLMVPLVSAVDISDSVGDNSEPFNESFLIITDVDVKVGSKTDKNLDHGDDISDEATPGDTVIFSIEVANIFTRDDDIEIEDITITVTIEGIDDDDDLEEESREFDLKEDKDEKKKIEFEIPLEVDEDTFDVLIEVEGDPRNNNSFAEARMELTIEVEKENNEVRFLKNSLTPSEIKCSRTVQLSVGVINTGSSNEDAVDLEVVNSDLGVSFREEFDLSDDPFDDDSKFRKTFTFAIPKEIPSGIYTLLSKVTFDDGSETETETADLVVGTCEALKPVEVEEEEEEVVVVQPTQPEPTTPTGGVIAQPVTTPTVPTSEEKESVFESTGFLAALIAGEVLLVIIAILIIVSVLRKRS